MEILTPNSDKVKEKSERLMTIVSFRKKENGLHISKEAMSRFLLKPGMHLVFIIDIDRLYFYIDKSEEGFYISNERNGGGTVYSRLLIRRIYERLPAAKRNGTRYGVRLSNTRINDSITFEIVLDKRV